LLAAAAQDGMPLLLKALNLLDIMQGRQNMFDNATRVSRVLHRAAFAFR
jgi:hypothetical protein